MSHPHPPHGPDHDRETATETTTPPKPRRAPLDAAARDLAARFVPLALSLAKPAKFRRPNDGDDLEAAAMLGLVEAAANYDESRGVHFSSFARPRIKGALLDAGRRLAAHGCRPECDPGAHPGVVTLAADVDPEAIGRVLGPAPGPPVGADLEASEWVDRALANLPAKHAAATRAVALDGLTGDAAAARLGCSPSRICELLKDSRVILGPVLGVAVDADGDDPDAPPPPEKRRCGRC